MFSTSVGSIIFTVKISCMEWLLLVAGKNKVPPFAVTDRDNTDQNEKTGSNYNVDQSVLVTWLSVDCALVSAMSFPQWRLRIIKLVILVEACLKVHDTWFFEISLI